MNVILSQKFCDGEGSVTRGVVMMEHPFVCNVWSHASDLFSEPIKDVFINTWLTICPGGTNSVWTIPLLSKKHQHRFDLRFAH